MNDAHFIARKLAYRVDGAEEVLAHTELLNRVENLVILGEPGMGKSRLLEELEDASAHRVTARRLINAHNPAKLAGGHNRLLVDALDEAPAFAEGGIVDQVLAKLELAGVERFVLACRAEDWQAATATSIISETYGEAPLELRLKPLDDAQIADFLAGQLGDERAEDVISIYRKLGLRDWLGNPQTLIMLAEVAATGNLPQTTSALFQAYVDLCLRDANPIRRQRQSDVPRQAVLDTLGATFGSLILSGKTALAKRGANVRDEDLEFSELQNLPGFVDWDAVSGNRLVITYGGDNDRLTYAHRRLGEWLGARWLAKYAQSDATRDRVIASLTVDGIVPASLRGLFAWLTLDQKFALQVIKTDPMAVIEYGDADVLDNKSAQALLDALEQLSVHDPWFAGWGDFRAKSLVRDALQSVTLQAVLDQSRSGRLRMLLARQFRGEELDSKVTAKLGALALDRNSFYALREEAVEALVGNFSPSQLRSFVDDLRQEGSQDATRLAAELILDAGIANFDDQRVVEAIFDACGHSICAVPAEPDYNMAARAWRYRYEIPDERLDGILDLLADYAIALLPEHRSLESHDIISLGDALLARRLRLGKVEPERLLHWLVGFGGRDSYVKDDEKSIADFLAANDSIRRSIQASWLLRAKTGQNVFALHHRLAELNGALHPTDEDVAALLDQLPPHADLGLELARLTRHSKTEGLATRAAAERFFPTKEEHARYFEAIINPPLQDWQMEQQQRAAKRIAEREIRWAEFRKGMAAERDALEQGRFGVILQGANAYLGRYSDLTDIKTAEARLEALCGHDLAKSVSLGFEAYLNILPPYPYARLVAKDYGRSRAWNARHILLAALAERVKQTGSVGQLTTDQIISAQLHIANHCVSGDEWEPLRQAVWAAVTERADDLETYARLLIEPSLRRKQEIVSGLYELLHEGGSSHPELTSQLALEWLQGFPHIHSRPEAELIDLILSRHERLSLRPLVERRLKMATLDDERRRNWLATGLICDFRRYAPKVAALAERDPGLLWSIRERLGARRPYDDTPDHVSVRLAAWLVEHFRSVFPVEERPHHVTVGNTNPWDATEAIRRLIDRVGSDTSAEAGELLRALAQIDDGYRERVLHVLAEHNRTRAENAKATIGPESLAAILSDGPPQSLPDMQVRLLDLLDRVEAQAKSSDTDVWVTFYQDDRKTPQNEEYCRDRVIDLLRQHERTIAFSPEKHLGDNREGDIACEFGDLHLPIEVKGQWHDDLWTAADAQLAAQQAIDHHAEGYGILLVLWFGTAGKGLKKPGRKLGIKTPHSPDELEKALTRRSRAASEGRIRIQVLDLSRD